ncbi:MAG: hypothetical protein R8G34_01675 [Paracoccaceae bacterium]|nr:hypothetical protein [Paracoccaceae bacterium]
MKHDGARLIFQTKLLPDLICRTLKTLSFNINSFWGVEAHGKEVVLSPCSSGNGISFMKRFNKVIAGKARDFVQNHMIIAPHR